MLRTSCNLPFSSFLFLFSTIGMLIYSIHTQRVHTVECLCLSNIGYLAQCSIAWSILIQVALEIHAPIHLLIACSWSRTSKMIFRKKSRNNKTIVLLEWWLNIRVQGSGLFSLPQLERTSLRVKMAVEDSCSAEASHPSGCSEAAPSLHIPAAANKAAFQSP